MVSILFICFGLVVDLLEKPSPHTWNDATHLSILSLSPRGLLAAGLGYLLGSLWKHRSRTTHMHMWLSVSGKGSSASAGSQVRW